MRTLNLLLGNSDRRISNLIEVMIRDLCYSHAVVNIIRAGRIDEFVQQGRLGEFDLAIFAPDSLLPGARQPVSAVSARSVVAGLRQIRAARTHQELPIIATSVSPEQELALTDAGTDCVLGLPFRFEELKAAVRLFLNMPTEVEEAPAERWSLAGFLMRGLQRLTTLY
jgi:DNA-binding NarL/FixJ family response regulator